MLTTPVNAAVGPDRVMIVSPADEIVLIDGLQDSGTYTVTVTRGASNTVVGSVTDVSPQDFGVDNALEINHAAAPTLCWDDPVTPDILPNDVVRLTGSGITGEDTVTVAGITTGGAVGNASDTAFTVAGTLDPALDTAPLDVFIRLALPADWRANATDPGNSLVVQPDGSWVATFNTGSSGGSNVPVNADIVDAAENDPRVLEASYGLGADAEGVPNEVTVVGPDGGDPLPEECPPVALRAISSVTPAAINAANPNSGVTVSGVTSGTGATVSVALSDGVNSLTTPGDGTVTVNGDGTWTASFPGPLTTLDGLITATATHSPVAGGNAQNTRTILKDTVAPAAPAVSPNGGAVTGPTSVFLTGGAGESLRYTVGNGSQPAPTAASGIVFGGPFTVVPGQTVKAVAVDAADNPSAVTTAAFTQAVVPPVVTPPPSSGGSAVLPLAPGIAQAKSGKPGGVKTAKARWRAPEANGAVVNGYRVRAFKIRPGQSAKKVRVVRIGASKTRVEMVLPRGTYQFQVRASSTAGKSPWSARSNQVRAR